MRVLSLFDGISCGQIALNRAGIHYDAYYASEVDKHAMKVTQHNYPGTIQLGDVRSVEAYGLPKINLLMGGSPCQGFSFAGKQLNFQDIRSRLFFEYVRLKNELSPTWFLLENVKMKKEYQDVISEHMGCRPIEINSALVSAQNRKRLYWTNIPVTIPEDKGLLLRDILNTSENHDYIPLESIEKAIYNYSAKVLKSGNKMGNMKFPDSVNKKSRRLVATNITSARETMHIEDDFSYLFPENKSNCLTPDAYLTTGRRLRDGNGVSFLTKQCVSRHPTSDRTKINIPTNFNFGQTSIKN